MKVHNMAEDGTKLLKMNSAGTAAAEDVHLMMMPTANDEIETAASTIFGNSFVRLISCFALERPSASKFRRRRFYGCLQAMKRPFGRTHLLVHLFTLCLAIRALYCLISIALAPSLGIVWLQSTLLLGSVGCSFVLIAALMQIATFDRHLEYRPLDRFAWLRAAAYSNPKNAPSSIAPNTAFCTLLIAFCFYLWAISSSTEIFFQAGYYNLLANLFNSGGKTVIPMPDIDGRIPPTMTTSSTILDNLTLSTENNQILAANNDSILNANQTLLGDNAQGQQSTANGDAGPTANLNLFGGGGIFLVSTVTAFENAWLCGLAISVHFFVANAVFLAYSEFMRELSEKIVTRKIAQNEELDVIMRRSDNLLRFVFFARMQFMQLGWAAFGVGAMVNLSAVLLFCQFDADKMRNLLLFANAPVNNLLTTFLLFATAAFLGIFFNSLIMDFRFDDLRRLLSLENSFPNPIDPNTQRLAQALLERLELANSFQMGLHRLQLMFTGQFPLIFAIIGIFNQDILQIIIFISTISTIIFLLGLAFKVAKWMKSSKDQNARIAMMKNI